MSQTLTSATHFVIACGLTWLIALVFKLKLTTGPFMVITLVIWFTLGMAWILCPAALHIYGPR